MRLLFVFLILLLATVQVTNAQTQVYSAYELLDSIGVNIHLHYTDTPYNDFAELIKPKLLELGIKHVRDGVYTYDGINADTFYYKRLRELVDEGIKLDLITGMETQWGEATDYSLLPQIYDWTNGGVVSFEGINEPDLQGVEDWVEVTRAAQQTLYETVKNEPKLADVAVLGPSPAFEGAKLGDLNAYMDYGNIHPYPGGKMPTGDENNQSTRRELERVSSVSADKPVMITETGYHTALKTESDHLPTSESAAAKYIPRLFLDAFERGVPRTYLYEFLSTQGDRDTNPEGAFGLLRRDGSETPAYTSLQTMLKVLAQAEPLENLTELDYTLGGPTEDLQTLLLQVDETRYVLALWLERSSWDRQARQDISVAPEPLTLSFGKRLSVSSYLLDGGLQNEDAVTELAVEEPLTLAVSDAVTLLELKLN